MVFRLGWTERGVEWLMIIRQGSGLLNVLYFIRGAPFSAVYILSNTYVQYDIRSWKILLILSSSTVASLPVMTTQTLKHSNTQTVLAKLGTFERGKGSHGPRVTQRQQPCQGLTCTLIPPHVQTIRPSTSSSYADTSFRNVANRRYTSR